MENLFIMISLTNVTKTINKNKMMSRKIFSISVTLHITGRKQTVYLHMSKEIEPYCFADAKNQIRFMEKLNFLKNQKEATSNENI